LINRIKNLAKTEDKKRLLGNFFSLSVLQAFTYILPLLTLPYLVRVLGVENFGLVMFAQAFIMFFNILVDYGFNLSATREVSIHRDNKEKLTEIFSSVMSIKFILIGASFMLLSIMVFSFEKFSQHWELYYLSFLMVIGQALFPIWYFQGLERMKYITIVNITSKLIFTIAIFIFIQNESDYIIVPILNGLGFILSGIIAQYIIFNKFNQTFKFKTLKLKEHFKNGFHVFLSISSSTVLSATPILLIGTFLDYTMAGYYSAFEKLVSAIKSFFYIINQTFFPRLSKIFTEDTSKYKTIWKKLSITTIISSILVYIILLIVSEFFIKYYLGQNFIEYMYIFYILAFSIIFYTIINSLGLNGLLVLGKHKQLSTSQIIPAAIFICISPIVLKNFGLEVFLFTILLTDLTIILIRIYFLRGFMYGKSQI
jgi:PST family polysaccharide transporter